MEELESELEIMEAAFGSDFKRMESSKEFERFSVRICVQTPTGSAEIQTVIQLPQQFPSQPLSCTVDGNLCNATMHEVNKRVDASLEDNPSIRSMEMVQLVQDTVSELSERSAAENRKETTKRCDNITIARFLIYFHHIMR
jgi:hypothetical protein